MPKNFWTSCHPRYKSGWTRPGTRKKSTVSLLAFVGVKRFLERYVDTLGLPWQAHDPTDLVKRGLSLRTKRREDVTQIDGILGVAVKVGTRRKPRRGYAVWFQKSEP